MEKDVFLRVPKLLMEEPLNKIGSRDSSIFSNAIFYEQARKSPWELHGLILVMDSAFEVKKVYKFNNLENEFKSSQVDIPQEIYNFGIRECLDEERFYTSWYYFIHGGYEILTWIKNDSLANGILYDGCVPINLENEIFVENKKHLELLALIRKTIQSKKLYQ